MTTYATKPSDIERNGMLLMLKALCSAAWQLKLLKFYAVNTNLALFLTLTAATMLSLLTLTKLN